MADDLILEAQFCALATSPSVQAWLYKFNPQLYKNFIDKLLVSTGCSYNKTLMKEVLENIKKIAGGTDQLYEFLRTSHPHAIRQSGGGDGGVVTTSIQSISVNRPVFPHYRPGVLTYPRRLVLTGSDLQQQINNLVADKIKFDYIIVGNVGYVEYLTSDDKNIINSIKPKNWLISAYRESR